MAKYLAEFIQPKLSFSNESACDNFKFKCNNGECVESELICDERPAQCTDGSDLDYCAKELSCVSPKYKRCPIFKECFIPDLKFVGNDNLNKEICQ